MSKTYSGSTELAKAPILRAEDFKKGLKIEGIVSSLFPTQIGLCYVISLKTPQIFASTGPEKQSKISVGHSMKGLQMALRSTGILNGQMQVGDVICLECTGVDKSTEEKGNPMVCFRIALKREDDVPPEDF